MRTALVFLCLAVALAAQTIPVNYDEAKVGSYTLPDPLVTADGKRITDAQAWMKTRRPERDFTRKSGGRVIVPVVCAGHVRS
jgi:hypothetical protein